jgi:hypothetical protein
MVMLGSERAFDAPGLFVEIVPEEKQHDQRQQGQEGP